MRLSLPPFNFPKSAYADALPDLVFADVFTVLDGILDKDGEYARLIARYAVKKGLGVFGKIRFVKGSVTALQKELPFPLKTLHFPFHFRHEVYMTDSGELSLSYGTVFKSNFYRLSALLLHEIAHLILSAETEYPLLLAADKVFLKDNADNPVAPTLSPVELYATRLSILLMEETAKLLNGVPQEKFLAQAESEKEKLKVAYQAFQQN